MCGNITNCNTCGQKVNLCSSCQPCSKCACMEEIMELKQCGQQMKSAVANLECRLTRDEKKIQENYDYLCELIGDFAEKEERDIADERMRAMKEETWIKNKLEAYILSNDKALAKEIADRIEGDNNLYTLLQEETSQRKDADIIINARIDRVAAGLEAEEVRAKRAENTLNNIKFDDTSYNSADKKIYFYANGNIVKELDATPFIKDGMVSDVRVENSDLVITFNTDAGHETIRIALSTIFNPNNYYSKQDISNLLGDYVTSIGVSGNNITWTKNGQTNNIIAPYAAKANADGDGHTISTTYLKKADGITGASINGRIITFTKGNGATVAITIPESEIVVDGYPDLTLALNNIIDRLEVLESMWKIEGSTLTPVTTKSVTAAGFYDSTISA